ncbi:MAG TPA: ABC transporter permease [Opitutaceae bacterium]|nr:ABC transporter permease [Opitutaceae bacterium]
MNWHDIAVVYAKELKDTLRDRRTIISMIVVPMLIMPALMFGFAILSVKVVKKARAETPTVMILGGVDSPAIVAKLAALESVQIVPPADDYATQISDKKVRAAVRIPEGFDAAAGSGAVPEVKIYHYEGEIKSGFAAQTLERFFRDQREARVDEAVAARGLPENFVRPFEIRRENVAPPQKVGGNMIGAFVPYIIIILCLTGAMYPAIDLTAGEKERGTMETILCSPVGRLDLVLGKFLLVMTAALATVVCAIISMGLSFVAGGMIIGKMIGGGAPGAGGAAMGGLPVMIDPMGIVAVFALVIPVSVFFAGLLLAVALFAKSYKEAQSYVSPLILVAIIPSVLGLLPGFELNNTLALVPVLNICLVSKEILSGVYDWTHITIVFGSMCVYAAASIAFCVAMFRRESVLFRG